MIETELVSEIALARWLKVVLVKIFGTHRKALLNTEAVPNLIPKKLVSKLSPPSEKTDRNICVADVDTVITRGAVESVPVTFSGQETEMYFSVIDEMMARKIVGKNTLSKSEYALYLGYNYASLKVCDEEIHLQFEHKTTLN